MANSPNGGSNGGSRLPLAALRRLMRDQPTPAVERCEMCGAIVPPQHRHLIDRTNRALVCACTACALLFEREGAAGGKYQLVPQRSLVFADFHMTDEQWDELMIPVNMAFFFYSTTARRMVAYYPSPAGATESLLSLERWEELVADNPILEHMAPDVEALLINRVRDAREHYLVPIDSCYELVGILRTRWRGLSGGESAWKAIEEFFAALRARSRVVRGVEDA
jgi:Family of unknown function (DUF5947)